MTVKPARPDAADREYLAGMVPAPTERDLPASRHEHFREYLVRETRAAPAGRRWGDLVRLAPRRRVLVVALATAIAIAGTAAIVARSGTGDDRPDVWAFGEAAMSPSLQKAIDLCRTRVSQFLDDSSGPIRLVNSGEAGDVALAVFLAADRRMLTCTVNGDRGHSIGGGPYRQVDWLPGPISIQSASGVEGSWSLAGRVGDWSLAGRVSAQVGRVVLTHGDGRSTIAKLAEGTFAVATDGARIGAGKATLVTYDKSGTVIDRRRPNWLENIYTTANLPYAESCWTDPAGAVIYGQPGPDCKPAYPWP